MDFSSINMPEIDAKKTEKKAKKIWKSLNEDKIEIKFVTTPMGLILMAVGLSTIVCISKCIGKMEQKCALKKKAKALAKEMTTEK